MTEEVGLTINGVPMHPARSLGVQCLVDDDGLSENIVSALCRGLPRIGEAPAHNKRLAIVGSGPSVKTYLDELREWDGDIWAINGAFHWLRQQDIIVEGFVCLDPGPGLESLLPFVPKLPTYYLAIVCDPGLFNHVEGRNIQTWFPDMTCKKDYPNGVVLVPGGTTCLTRAPFLAHIMGYRDITIFGGDSSFDGEVYCYNPLDYACSVPPEIKRIKVGDRFFFSNRQMLHQVANLIGLTCVFGNMLKFRVGGLMAAMLEAPVVEPDWEQKDANG